MLFSVIIPTYNRAHLLAKGLDALASQTFKDFEVIICDDGSTDNTKELVDSYKNLLPGLQYIKIQNSGWASKPRNTAMNKAKGKWICFLDSDDHWLSSKLQVVFENIKRFPKTDVFFHDVNIVTREGKLVYVFKGRELNKKNSFTNLLFKGNKIPLSSACVRAEAIKAIGNFEEDTSFFNAEDYDFWIRAARAGCNFTHIRQILGNHLAHDSNISSGETYDRNALKVPDKYSVYLSAEKLRQYKLYRQYRMGIISYQRQDFDEAKQSFRSLLFKRNFETQAKSAVRLFEIAKLQLTGGLKKKN